MKKAVLFDLDGTLLDTTDDIGLALEKTLDCSFTRKQVDSYIGNGLKNAVKAAMVETGRDLSELDVMYERLCGNYKAEPVRYSHSFDGVPQMVARMIDAGIKVGIFSNKNHDILLTVVAQCLKGLDFSFIAGRNGQYKAKPDPQAVFDFARQEVCSMDEMLFVGDSEVDYRCAQNAGCDVVLVPWGSRSRKSLLEKGIPMDVFADSVDDVLRVAGI